MQRSLGSQGRKLNLRRIGEKGYNFFAYCIENTVARWADVASNHDQVGVQDGYKIGDRLRVVP